MIPILYDSNETLFTSNGLGRLRDCISCLCYEERNGIYEVDFEYPTNGANFDKIQLGRIIGVTHDESGDIQPFDIVSYSRPIDGVVTFHCTHISYRQSKMVSYASGINSLADAFQAFDDTCYPSGNPFTYFTDKESTGYVAAFDGTPRSIRSLLGGVEGSILDAYGGEYEWDKFFVRLHSARGVQRNFSIRYGINMTDFQDDTDYSEAYNTCVPYWKSSDGTTVIGSEVSSGQGTIGNGDKCVPLDLTDKFEEQPTAAALESMAASVMASNRPYLPSQTIKVDFIRLQDEAGFDQFDNLLQCKLCDSIKVVFPHYDMSAYYKIVKTTWNVLLDRYDEMELGNLSTTLAEALGVSNSGGFGTSGGEAGSADYVVEQATSGIWTYRKWNSGIAECWGGSSSLHPTFGSSYGNGYYAPAVADNNFPAGLFTTAPELMLSPISADGVWLGVSALTSAGFTYYPYCVMSGAHYYQWDAYAVGTWK